MKKVLLAVVGILFAATSFAQNGLVASLSHGTNITYFYGVNALKDAVTAAEKGDIINLSGGSFNATDITKAITLRGAGIDSKEPTYIVNNFTIEIPVEDTNQFTMEGIRCSNTMATKGTFANPYFLKCQFNVVSNSSESDAVTNIMFVNCKITGNINVGANDSYYFVNCYVKDIAHYQNASLTATNCIINSIAAGLSQSEWYNCIFYTARYTEGGFPNDVKCINCYSLAYGPSGYAYGIFRGPSCINCKEFPTWDSMFKSFTGKYTDEETFELTDEAKMEYIGNDAKESGLYGGLKPYNSTPSYPLVSSLTTDAQTDADGNLKNVKVVVSNPE